MIIMEYLYLDYDEKRGSILIIAGVVFVLTGIFLEFGTLVYY